MFQYQANIRLEHTDATGYLFFPKQFNLTLEAFEHFLMENKVNLRDILYGNDLSLPVVHTESDYFYPLQTNDKIIISVKTSKIGDSSFEISYHLTHEGTGIQAGTVKTVHTAISKQTRNSVLLPPNIKKILENHL